ncbi:MAG: phosphoribosylglycinamide formyltransferase [Thermoplasmata archaeon]
MPFNIAVFASGRGSNFEAIIKEKHKKNYIYNVSVLVTDNPQARAINIAKENKIPFEVIEKKEGMKRIDHENEISKALSKYSVELIVLAGYMRILSSEFVNKWKFKIINIHPSLLPAFGGKGMFLQNIHKSVIERGCKVSGCTVHYVTEDIDNGPIIYQKVVKVLPNDTPDILEKRILKKEHIALPYVINEIANNRVKIINGLAYIIKDDIQ